VLVDAFALLARMPGMERTRLHVAGWLGNGDRAFFDEQIRKLEQAGLTERFHYAGVLERREKLDFLQGLHVLSVPTVYREPKGIFVLESLASGVPIVQPDHGAFPELVAGTGGGRLVRPDDAEHLAATLYELLIDGEQRRELAQRGQAAVHRDYSAATMAERTLDVYQKFLGAAAPVAQAAETSHLKS
jgi:glycosyltransferase involved in cell wall biosynthesis